MLKVKSVPRIMGLQKYLVTLKRSQEIRATVDLVKQ